MPETKSEQSLHWDIEIQPQTRLFDWNLREVWRYRDLMWMLVRRDFVSIYKQTILGPLWFLIQPLLTTGMYFLIFSRIARLSTDGVPPTLFYLAGITCWGYFQESLLRISDTFITNSNIFGKVYFPRIVIPVSVVISNFVRFFIQLFLFLVVWIYYLFFTDIPIQPNWTLFPMLPILMLMMAGLALGLGMLISSLTTKYRDLRFLLTFGVQLLMFATPVVYPLSISSDSLKPFLLINPITAIVETFRSIFLGTGIWSWGALGYSFSCMLALLLLGITVFNRVEKKFMDTV
jgi:lipopolysaccharide transport system permease protein